MSGCPIRNIFGAELELLELLELLDCWYQRASSLESAIETKAEKIEEQEAVEEEADNEDDDEGVASHLHVNLAAKEREQIWAQELVLLDIVQRRKCERWNLVCNSLRTSHGFLQSAKDYS